MSKKSKVEKISKRSIIRIFSQVPSGEKKSIFNQNWRSFEKKLEILNSFNTSTFLRSKWVEKSKVEKISKRSKFQQDFSQNWRNFEKNLNFPGGKKNQISTKIKEIIIHFLKKTKSAPNLKFLVWLNKQWSLTKMFACVKSC